MRIRMLTGSAAVLFCGILLMQAAAKPLPANRVVPGGERTLELPSRGKVIRSYKVAPGGDPVGPKTRHWDHETREGDYTLDSRNAHSPFCKSIHIPYPSARDRAAARAQGVSAGGDGFVHGLPNGYG